MLNSRRSNAITIGSYSVGFVLILPSLLGSMGLFDGACNLICGAERFGGWFDRIEIVMIIPTLLAIIPLSLANYRIHANQYYHAMLDMSSYLAVIFASADLNLLVNGSVVYEILEGPVALLGLVAILFNLLLILNVLFKGKSTRGREPDSLRIS